MSGKEAATPKQSSGLISRLMVAALVAVAVILLLRAILPQTIGEQTRRHFQKTLREHYSEYDVAVGKGHYDPSIGLIFEDIVIADPSPPAQLSSWTFASLRSKEMIRIDKLVVIANTQPKELLEKRNPLVTQRVILEGVHIDTWMDENGKFAIQDLWPPPQLGPAAPRIEVRRAKVSYSDPTQKTKPIDLDVSELVLVNNRPSNRSSEFGTANHAQPPPDGLPSGTQSFSLRATSGVADVISIDGTANQNGLVLAGAVRSARFNTALIDSLPQQFREPLREARGLDCIADLAFKVSQPVQGDLDYQLKLAINEGRFAHERLPQAIESLRGVVICDPSGATIQASQGICGEAVCRLNGFIGQYKWPDNASFNVSVNGLRLDDRLRKSIPANMLPVWEKFQPNGHIDITQGKLAFRNDRWVNEATIDCIGVDVLYDKFPYPIEHLVGQITIHNGIARCDRMDGRIGGQKLRCAFQVPTKPSPTDQKMFGVTVDGPIAIDETLIRALSHRGSPTSKLESFVRSLRPRGSVHLVNAELSTDASGKQSRTIGLRVTDGHLRYEKFPYPLYNVKGTIHVQDNFVTLHQFHGTNANAGQIHCDGSYRIIPPSQQISNTPGPPNESVSATHPQLQLKFKAQNIPMDDSLRTSLPENARGIWERLSPSGVLDSLDVKLSQIARDHPLRLEVTGIESESQRLTNRALSIQPTCIPYRMDITNGQVYYDGTQVKIYSLSAQHGATRISASGDCLPDPNGRWQLALDIQSGSRIAPDSELIASLPGEMQMAMRRLQLRRPISVRGKTNFLLASDQHPEPVINWDVVLQLEGNRIGDVGPVHSLRGEILANGTRDEAGIRSQGEVRIDSLHLDELQITQLRGPFSINGERLRLGSRSGQLSSPQPPLGTPESGLQQVTYQRPLGNRRIRGRMFGGEVELAGEVEMSSGSFDVDVSLINGKVPTLLADFGQGRSELTGTITGQAELEGILGTTDLLKGVGSARVTGANVYQLPLLVQLLNLLRITPTEDVAFTDADVEFTLIENEMTFNDLKLWGDLVALQGGGTLDRRGELDLTFNTRVSPEHGITNVFRPFRSKRYTLWTVDVRGPIDAPMVQRRALDGVGQTLERLFPVMNSDSQPVQN